MMRVSVACLLLILSASSATESSPSLRGVRKVRAVPTRRDDRTVQYSNSSEETNQQSKRNLTKSHSKKQYGYKTGSRSSTNVAAAAAIQTPNPTNLPTFNPTLAPTPAPTTAKPTPLPTWTFEPPKAEVQGRVEKVCSYCEGGCFDDNAMVYFTQGSSATCSQIRELAPKLSSSQCEIEREFIEDACCCEEKESEPTQGRLPQKGPKEEDNPCTFCTGKFFVNLNVVTFSNGSDMVTCEGLASLVDAGLDPNFCRIERDAIEEYCCSDTEPVTVSPVATATVPPNTTPPVQVTPVEVPNTPQTVPPGDDSTAAGLPIISQTGFLLKQPDGTTVFVTEAEFAEQYPEAYEIAVAQNLFSPNLSDTTEEQMQPETDPVPEEEDPLDVPDSIVEDLGDSNTTLVDEAMMENEPAVKGAELDKPPSKVATIAGGGKREVKPIGPSHTRNPESTTTEGIDSAEGRIEEPKKKTATTGDRVKLGSGRYGGAAISF